MVFVLCFLAEEDCLADLCRLPVLQVFSETAGRIRFYGRQDLRG